jgi:hypothetical protein
MHMHMYISHQQPKNCTHTYTHTRDKHTHTHTHILTHTQTHVCVCVRLLMAYNTTSIAALAALAAPSLSLPHSCLCARTVFVELGPLLVELEHDREQESIMYIVGEFYFGRCATCTRKPVVKTSHLLMRVLAVAS